VIIGLGYKARSGKDTVGEYLKYFYDFHHVYFAESLKTACGAIFKLTNEQLYGKDKENIDPYWGKSPRELLQTVGTDLLRNQFDRSIWIKSIYKLIQQFPERDYVITDVRYPNEAVAVKKWGGLLIHINRPNKDDIGSKSKHSSETSLDDFNNWDFTLQNDRTIKDLHSNVDKIMSKLGKVKHESL